MTNGKKERLKTVSVSPEVHRELRIFVAEQENGFMQEWAEQFLKEGIERARAAEQEKSAA